MFRRHELMPRPRGRRLLGTVSVTLAVAVVGLFATAGGALASLRPTAKATSKVPIYIGCPCALSGVFASFELPAWHGVEVGSAEINNQGGVLGGRKFKPVAVDDTSDPTKGALAIQQLLSQYPLAAYIEDPVATAAQVPYSTQYGIPAFSPGTGPWFNPAQDPYSFNNYAGGAAQIPASVAAAQYVHKGGGSVAVITDTTQADVLLGQETTAALTPVGYPTIDTEQVAPTATDISVQVDAALSKNPSIIYLYSSGAVCLSMPRALTTAAHAGVDIIITAACSIGASLLDNIPPSAGGDQIYIQSWTAQLESGKLKGALPKYQPLAKLLNKITGSLQDGIFSSAIYTDTLELLAWAMDKSGAVKGKKVLTALQSLHKSKLPSSGIGHLVLLSNPEWSPSVHDLTHADLSHFYSIIRGGPPVNGVSPGVPLITKPVTT